MSVIPALGARALRAGALLRPDRWRPAGLRASAAT
jgi:hypothetical protein